MRQTKAFGGRMFLLILLVTLLSSSVYAVSLTTSKTQYSADDLVEIYFSIVENAEISIVSEGENYRYLGDPSSPLKFIPRKTGVYFVEMRQQGLLLDKTSFSVIDNSNALDYQELFSKSIVTINPLLKVGTDTKFLDSEIVVYEDDLPIAQLNNLESKVIPITKQSHKVVLLNKNSTLGKITFNQVNISDKFNLFYEELPAAKANIKNQVVINAFAIDPSNLNFESADATFIAKGRELYKCADWNFSQQSCFGSWEKLMDIIPGREYNITLSPDDPGFAETGIASINTNKSLYHLNESAKVTIVVLDTDGSLVSDADITLNITSPSGVTSVFSTPIDINESKRGVYSIVYNMLHEEGNYSMVVSAFAENVNNTMISYFTVKDYYEFDILRKTPVTVDPWQSPFYSNITLLSYTNVSQFTFTEFLPEEFSVYSAPGATITTFNNKKSLTWYLLTNGSTVSYAARPPLRSPELFELGPAELLYNNKIFTESRVWYLAIDPVVIYDPSYSISTGWSSGTGTTYAEIDDITKPDTNDHVASGGNAGESSEFGFPNITQQNVANIVLYVYTATGSNVYYTFELRQSGSLVCSNTLTTGFTGWRNCTWPSVTGSLTNLSIYLGGVSKSGGGPTGTAYVYTAYLEIEYDNYPVVSLNNPENDALLESDLVEFNFTVTDDTSSTISSCALYTNFSGSWGQNVSVSNVQNNSKTNLTVGNLDEGVYVWNVQCTDSATHSSFAPDNYTIKINKYPPQIIAPSLNESIINQSEKVRFNVTVLDNFGISSVIATLKYPDGIKGNYTLFQNGDEFYYDFGNTTQIGFYNVTLVWANDSLGQIARDESPNLYFEVTASPPSSFNLTSPPNNTVSQDLLPNMSWAQTVESHFTNYTLLFDKDPGFSTPDFTYYTYQIDNTSYLVDYALDANSIYYWKVVAYDIFGSSTESTDFFKYITDTIAPTVTLDSPAPSTTVSTKKVIFVATPTDTNGLDSCVLYHNVSGTWQKNVTNSSIISEQPSSMTTNLTEGKFVWNVECNDSANNKNFATTNRTITVDLSPPIVYLLSPENNTLNDTTNNLIFIANATDSYSSIDSCELIINNEIKKTENTILDSQPFNFTVFLINGYYNWSVNCTDDFGFESSSQIYNLSVLVVDNNPPFITLNHPESYDYLDSPNITFNYTPEDATGIENCTLFLDGLENETDTLVENFVPNYFNISIIDESLHNWTVHCHDNSTEYNNHTASVDYFTVDLTDPSVDLNLPLDEGFLSNSSVLFNYTPVEDNIDYCVLYGNFTTFEFTSQATNSSPQNNTPNFFNKTLDSGSFIWNIECVDFSGRSSFASQNYSFSIDIAPPYYSDLTATPSSPTIYNSSISYQFNSTWQDNFVVHTVLIEHNFTSELKNYSVSPLVDLYSYDYPSLAAGSYVYRWYSNDTSNNQNQTSQYSYIVNKSASNITLLLNNTPSNFSVVEDTHVNITGEILIPDSGYVELFLEGILINNGSSPLENITFFSNPGIYNITLKYPFTQNYSSSSRTSFLFVNDTTPPTINLMSPNQSAQIGSLTVIFYYNVSDYSSLINCSLYIDESLVETDSTIQKQSTLNFTRTLEEGNHSWKVGCFDSYQNFNFSETRNFTVQRTDKIIVIVSTNKDAFEEGETAFITTQTKDVFSAPLPSNITLDLIFGRTSTSWWDSSWLKRKPIYLTETLGQNHSCSFASVNITGLNSTGLSNCEQIRIIKNESVNRLVVPYEVYSGNNNDWCYVGFKAEISENTVNNSDYYVYYNNTDAPNSNHDINSTSWHLYVAKTAATDEGDPVNVSHIVGKNDSSFAFLEVSGGGATIDSAHGRDFINHTPSTTILEVLARFRYEVPVSRANWYLRSSVDDGGSYLDEFAGTAPLEKTTSPWRDLTSRYAQLNWSEINRTRLQGRVTKPGGSSAVSMHLYWVELNVSVRADSLISQTGVGSEQNFVLSESYETGLDGSWVYEWGTYGYDLGNYSAVSVANSGNLTNSSGYKIFEVVPDTTAPNVTLIYPPDLAIRGVGFVNFTFSAFDYNLENCTLYVDLEGTFLPNQTLSNLNSSQNYTFDPVYLGIGLHEWNVNCTDRYYNWNFSGYNFSVNVTGPDLTLTQDDIWFGNESRIERNNITLFANISNIGLTDAIGNFTVQFFRGDPSSGGTRINGNLTLTNLSIGQQKTVNVSYAMDYGNNEIFVLVDSFNNTNESDENNNKAAKNLSVGLYQYFYGNFSVTITLDKKDNSSLVSFRENSRKGHILIADLDSVISFSSLKAITRNRNGNPTADDFSDIDENLDTFRLDDSIKNVWGGGTDNPIVVSDFNLTSGLVTNVPIVNSTINSNFVTGILWDSSDDISLNLQYDTSDDEDLVFVSRLNQSQVGGYGIYDYEIRAPVALRDYKGPDSNRVKFYYEIT